MSDHSEEIDNGKISRREALATGAKVAGVAAFATPTVMGVFSSRASAQVFTGCDPAVDSDALDLLEGKPRKWNTNCSSNERQGRYNAQRTEATLEGTNQTAAINFGFFGTDNFPHECSFYWFDVPDGWQCSATFVLGDANDTDGCPDGDPYVSTPGDCTPWPTPESPTPADFLSDLESFFGPQSGWPVNTPSGTNENPGEEDGPYPVPYCSTLLPNKNGEHCVSNAFLWLIEWVCCPTSV